MVDITTDLITSSPSRWGLTGVVTSVQAALSSRLEKRRLYQRTLHELQTYSRRNLLDMGIDPDALHDLARRAAGL